MTLLDWKIVGLAWALNFGAFSNLCIWHKLGTEGSLGPEPWHNLWCGPVSEDSLKILVVSKEEALKSTSQLVLLSVIVYIPFITILQQQCFRLRELSTNIIPFVCQCLCFKIVQLELSPTPMVFDYYYYPNCKYWDIILVSS